MQAAKQGLGVAEANVGAYYARGMVVSRDLEEAQVWFKRAAEHGYKVPENWMTPGSNGEMANNTQMMKKR
jgi:TPR repeat protein